MHPATDQTHTALDDFAASTDAAAELALYKQIVTATANALRLPPGGDLNAIPATAAEAHDAARNLREQVERLITERQRLADGLDDAHAEIEQSRAELEKVTAERDNARNKVGVLTPAVSAWRTSALAMERERNQARAEMERLRAELDESARSARDSAAYAAQAWSEVERLRVLLREILGHFDQVGSIGEINNVVRTCWVTKTKLDGWRAALTTEAGEHRA